MHFCLHVITRKVLSITISIASIASIAWLQFYQIMPYVILRFLEALAYSILGVGIGIGHCHRAKHLFSYFDLSVTCV